MIVGLVSIVSATLVLFCAQTSEMLCLCCCLVLSLDLPEGSGTPAIIAVSIEEEIYKEFKRTDNKYKNKIRSRVSNLRDKKNPALRENVLLGSISAERLVRMSPEVRAPRARFTLASCLVWSVNHA